MKTAIILIAAGVLSASVAHAQSMQPNGQVKSGTAALPPEVNSQRMYQGSGGAQLGSASQILVPPSGKVPAGQAQIGGVALPPLPANLQDPATAGKATTDIFAIMQLLQQVAAQQRASARESRDAAQEAQVSAIQDAAEKMKQAAAAAMQQAQINGAMQIAAGAAQMGAGTIAVKPGSSASKVLETNPQGQTMPPAGSKFASLTPQEKQQVVGTIANAQQVFAANMNGAEADKEKAQAVAALLKAQGQVQTAQQAQAQQTMQQMQDMIRDVQAKLQAIQQAQTATMQQVIRN